MIEAAWTWLCGKFNAQLLDADRLAGEWNIAWARQRGFARRDADREAKRAEEARQRRSERADEGYSPPPVSRGPKFDLSAEIRRRREEGIE